MNFIFLALIFIGQALAYESHQVYDCKSNKGQILVDLYEDGEGIIDFHSHTFRYLPYFRFVYRGLIKKGGQPNFYFEHKISVSLETVNPDNRKNGIKFKNNSNILIADSSYSLNNKTIKIQFRLNKEVKNIRLRYIGPSRSFNDLLHCKLLSEGL
ncbi:MAG: hypothetical protein AB7I27_19100 [Bacteriovoracaceae bacterium]